MFGPLKSKKKQLASATIIHHGKPQRTPFKNATRQMVDLIELRILISSIVFLI